jgi:hypothetical protein
LTSEHIRTGLAAQPVIAGEAKSTERGLDMLLGEMRHCAVSRCSAETPDRSRGHKKYVGLLDLKPLVFWAVAPGVRLAYRVDFRVGVVHLDPVDEIPGPDAIIPPPSRHAQIPALIDKAPNQGDQAAEGLMIRQYGKTVFCPLGAFVEGRALSHKPTAPPRNYRLNGLDGSIPPLLEIWEETDVKDGQRRHKHGLNPRIRGQVTSLIETVAPLTARTGTPGGETPGEFRERLRVLSTGGQRS